MSNERDAALEKFVDAMKLTEGFSGWTLPELLDACAVKMDRMAFDFVDFRVGGSSTNSIDVAPYLREANAKLKAAMITASGGVPLISKCSDCEKFYDAKPGGEIYPPDLRISHGQCPPCHRRYMERFVDCKDTKDIR